MKEDDYYIGRVVFVFIKYTALFFILTGIFRPFQNLYPSLDKSITAVTAILAVAFILLNYTRSVIERNVPESLFLVSSVIFITAVSYIKSNIVFGQSLKAFMFSKVFIKYISSLSPMILFYLLKFKKIKVKELINVFKISAFIYLLIYLYVKSKGVDINKGEGITVAKMNLEKSDLVFFQFNIDIITILLSYYIIKLVRDSYIYLLPIIGIFGFYITTFRQRTLTAIIGVMSLYAFVKALVVKRLASTIAVAICFLPLIGIVVLALFQEHLLEFLETYNKMLSFMFNAKSELTGNVSIRVVQVERAKKFLYDNLMFGVGYLGGIDKGFFKEFGGYFIPEDIGIIGNVLVHGIFGYVLFLFFAISPFIMYRKKVFTSVTIILALKCYCVLLLLKMLYTMVNFSLPSAYFLPYILLCLKPTLLLGQSDETIISGQDN